MVMVIDYLQVWCEIKTPEALLGQVLGDPHSPGRFRVVSASHPQHCVTLNQNTHFCTVLQAINVQGAQANIEK